MRLCFRPLLFVTGLLAVSLAQSATGTVDSHPLFSRGQLSSGVNNWSWNLCNTSPTAVVRGLTVLAFDECRGGAWSAGGQLYLNTPLTSAVSLTFDIYLGMQAAATAQEIGMSFGAGTQGVALSSLLPKPRNNAWNTVTVTLAPLMNGLPVQQIMWMNSSGHPKFYLNNVFLTVGGGSVPPSGSAVSVSVDATAQVHPISPLIYGVAATTDTAQVMKALNSPINRWGGNASSSYNWQLDATNHAQDWFYESIAMSGATAPASFVKDFVSANQQAGAASMVTVPMLPWVAKLGPNRGKLASFSVSKYGPQQFTDAQWMPDAGNGVHVNGSLVAGNDPNDANVPSNESFQQGLVSTLVQQFGTAASGGVRYYLLDNEVSIWHSTHRDVHPQGAGMDEVLEAMTRYARAIRAADPGAQIVGPEEWGWAAYLFSGKDQQAQNWSAPPDKLAHGGMDYVPWLLQQATRVQQSTGLKLLDVFSLHYYPQSGEYSSDTSAAMQALRNQSTRSLWDPNYKDKSWIADKVMLIPRMKAWVQQYAPGLKLALTEYSWGADNHINGATTQADILGILGREGLDIATRWEAPPTGSPTFKAFQIYRNADGQKHGFGETSVQATAPNPDQVSAFAALRASDKALTVMVVNKDTASHPLKLHLAHFGSGAGGSQRWQLTSNGFSALGALSYSGGAVSDTLPPQSVTLYVLH
jgi:hypothetical protein